jgi:DNA-binding response OmpR family regulator
MSPQPSVRVLVVYSRERPTADFLKWALDSAGFAAFVAPDDLSRLDAFIRAIHPHAVVVDMARATDAHWQELMQVRCRPSWDDSVPLVLTTADESGVRQWMTGSATTASAIVEMFTHAEDLRELRAAVESVVVGPRLPRTSATRLAS